MSRSILHNDYHYNPNRYTPVNYGPFPTPEQLRIMHKALEYNVLDPWFVSDFTTRMQRQWYDRGLQGRYEISKSNPEHDYSYYIAEDQHNFRPNSYCHCRLWKLDGPEIEDAIESYQVCSR